MKQYHLPKDQNKRAQLIKSLQSKISKLTKNEKKSINSHSQFAQKEQQSGENTVQAFKNEIIDQQLVNPSIYESEFNITPHVGTQNNQKFVKILKLRLKLIGDCSQLSVERIEHLQQIFKHYCTHIFKIGKHMTFQRLEYEKVHLTLDRLCVFLKDFGLNTTKVDQVDHQIIDKKEIIRNFKRMSKTCRDLSFQQFIACLQKLAIVYYDQKQIFQQKITKNRVERDTRIAQYKRRMKEKKKQQERREEEIKKLQLQLSASRRKQQIQDEGQKKQQNDEFVEQMMEDQIQNPNDQINKAMEKGKGGQQNQFSNETKQIKKYKEKSKIKIIEKQIEEEYQLSVEQKVQYFYQLIGVDNVQDFRNKMSQLGLPLFKNYQSQIKIPQKKSTSTKTSNEILNILTTHYEAEDQHRLKDLRQKINIKKQRDKHLYSPLISRQQYEERKKKREQKQSNLAKQMSTSKISGIQKTNTKDKQKQGKKVQLLNQELSLDMLNNISFDDLKNKFDPKKYVHNEESDKIYLNQYGVQVQAGKKSVRKNLPKSIIRQNTATTLQRKRTSSNIVQDFKKRAYEMEVKQFHKEAELTKFVNQMKRKQKWRKQIK